MISFMRHNFILPYIYLTNEFQFAGAKIHNYKFGILNICVDHWFNVKVKSIILFEDETKYIFFFFHKFENFIEFLSTWFEWAQDDDIIGLFLRCITHKCLYRHGSKQIEMRIVMIITILSVTGFLLCTNHILQKEATLHKMK